MVFHLKRLPSIHQYRAQAKRKGIPFGMPFLSYIKEHNSMSSKKCQITLQSEQ